MDDYISRKAAIGVLEKDKEKLNCIIRGIKENDVRLCNYVAQHNQLDYDIDAIRNLPSAQPEADCQKCIFCGFQGFKQFQTAQPKTEERSAETVQNVPKDDLISRKAAIDAIEDHMKAYTSKMDGYNMARRRMKELIEVLPSAQPEHLVKEYGDLVKDLVNDCISRKDAINVVKGIDSYFVKYIEQLPPAQLYGYSIEHLARIAKLMQMMEGQEK